VCSVTDIVVVLIKPTREWLFVEWASSVGGRVVVAVEPQLYLSVGTTSQMHRLSLVARVLLFKPLIIIMTKMLTFFLPTQTEIYIVVGLYLLDPDKYFWAFQSGRSIVFIP
jgi:hypothetical protein